eukprot:TRINITY_DN602_c1_g1_i1.p1 TRINITY_DN602_c1_g1~~TRINITY_DN602_c1_g1_i1.p1  ORF type:complete len:599 (+),score=227.63 TRINITY_DN602_c1_g1_i1:137-1933(+)
MDLNSYGLDGFGFHDDYNVPSISPPHNAYMNYGNDNQVVATSPPNDLDLNFELSGEMINMGKMEGFGCEGLMNNGFEMFSGNNDCNNNNDDDCNWLGEVFNQGGNGNLLENLKVEDTMDFSQFTTECVDSQMDNINGSIGGDFIVPNVENISCIATPIKQQTKRGRKKSDVPKIKAPQTRTTGRAKPKKTRKRKRRSHLEVHAETCITFTREQLLKMTSEDFEAAVRELESERPITEDEEKEIKRQRRLIKNRESAQASRERKKKEEEERQRIISDLKEENRSLKAKNTSLEDEVRSLREKNQYLQNENTRLRHTENNFVEIPITDMKSENAVQDKKIDNKKNSRLSSFLSISGKPNTNKTGAGVCLMILLLSVGLLFNMNPYSLQSLEYPSTYSHGKIISDYNAINQLPLENSNNNNNNNLKLTSSYSNSLRGSSNSPFDRRLFDLEDMSFSSSSNNNIENMEEVEINQENSYSSVINNFSTATAANYSTETHNININNTNSNRLRDLALQATSKELISINSSQQIEIDLSSTYLICENITQAGLPIEENFNKPSFEFNLVIPPSALNLDSSEPALELVCNVIDVKSKSLNPIYITS